MDRREERGQDMVVEMELRILNWRCIADEKIELSKKINIFFGKNSTGKSSVAYAIYMLGRLHEKPERLVSSLFGGRLQSLVRIENGDRKYPLELSLKSDDRESSIILDSDGLKVKKKDQIWSETYMAIAGRYGLLLTYSALSDFLSSVMKDEVSKEEKKKTIKLLSAFLSAINPSLRLSLLAAYPISEVKDSPSGLVDYTILNLMVSKAKNNSLIVIEEPESHKNPVMQIELMKNLIKAVKEKNLTLVLTTHSETIIHTVLKEIEEGYISSDDVKFHHFIRSEQKSWTEIKEINVHEDGSLEEPLEDFIEAFVELF